VGVNKIPWAPSESIPAAIRKDFLSIRIMRIAQKGLFLNHCNIVGNLFRGIIYTFESIAMKSDIIFLMEGTLQRGSAPLSFYEEERL
jgi:hypothetical protein